MKDSLVRTIVPLIVGFVITQAARVGVEIDEATVASLVTSAVSAAYYAAVRFLETRRAWWGWLLGSPRQPSY